MNDVIVVGGGVVGLSTARYLAKTGSKTLLIDQYDLPHSYGSSHGKSRGIRHTYETYHHVQMMPEAFDEWRMLENETKSKLLITCGIICLCNDKERNAMAHNMTRINMSCKLLVASEIEKMFPGFKPNGMDGIYEENAGILKADDCLWALKTSFLLAGGHIAQSTVEKVEVINEHMVHIHTNKHSYTAKSVILTSGPWINNLLKPFQLRLPISIKRSLIIYWKTRTPSSYLCDKFPLTCVTKPTTLVYAVPVCEYPGYMKIGIHDGIELDSASNRDKILNESEAKTEKNQIEKLQSVIKDFYPEVVPEPCLVQNCMYSATPDEDFILDNIPNYSNVIIGAGFSGHVFKLAPVVGSILGKLALNKEQKYSLEPFLLKRFKNISITKS